MQTERVAIALRPRQGWEALDLGFAMVRAWWRPLFGAWLLVVLPCAALIHLLLYDHLWLALLAFWWLKPLYDRVALSVLSDSLFGDVPTVRQTLARLPGRLRGGLAPSLLWLRFSPLRALQLPVLQLEGQRGAGRRRRTRVLAGRESHLPIALQFACLQFELVLGSAELLIDPATGQVQRNTTLELARANAAAKAVDRFGPRPRLIQFRERSTPEVESQTPQGG